MPEFDCRSMYRNLLERLTFGKNLSSESILYCIGQMEKCENGELSSLYRNELGSELYEKAIKMKREELSVKERRFVDQVVFSNRYLTKQYLYRALPLVDRICYMFS